MIIIDIKNKRFAALPPRKGVPGPYGQVLARKKISTG